MHDRKTAEIALRDSERMFRALFEGTSIAVTIRDVHEQSFLDCNPAALRLYGCSSREQLKKTKPWQLCPERQPDGRLTADVARQVIDLALREGSARFEWRARRLGDGEEFDASLRITTITLEDGRRVMQTFIEDISDRKRAELATIERARREALVSRVSRQFVTSNVDDAIPFALEALGTFLGARRVRARVSRDDAVHTIAEWRGDGVAAIRDAPEPVDDHPTTKAFADRLYAHGCVAIGRLARSPRGDGRDQVGVDAPRHARLPHRGAVRTAIGSSGRS